MNGDKMVTVSLNVLLAIGFVMMGAVMVAVIVAVVQYLVNC